MSTSTFSAEHVGEALVSLEHRQGGEPSILWIRPNYGFFECRAPEGEYGDTGKERQEWQSRSSRCAGPSTRGVYNDLAERLVGKDAQGGGCALSIVTSSTSLAPVFPEISGVIRNCMLRGGHANPAVYGAAATLSLGDVSLRVGAAVQAMVDTLTVMDQLSNGLIGCTATISNPPSERLLSFDAAFHPFLSATISSNVNDRSSRPWVGNALLVKLLQCPDAYLRDLICSKEPSTSNNQSSSAILGESIRSFLADQGVLLMQKLREKYVGSIGMSSPAERAQRWESAVIRKFRSFSPLGEETQTKPLLKKLFAIALLLEVSCVEDEIVRPLRETDQLALGVLGGLLMDLLAHSLAIVALPHTREGRMTAVSSVYALREWCLHSIPMTTYTVGVDDIPGATQRVRKFTMLQDQLYHEAMIEMLSSGRDAVERVVEGPEGGMTLADSSLKRRIHIVAVRCCPPPFHTAVEGRVEGEAKPPAPHGLFSSLMRHQPLMDKAHTNRSVAVSEGSATAALLPLRSLLCNVATDMSTAMAARTLSASLRSPQQRKGINDRSSKDSHAALATIAPLLHCDFELLSMTLLSEHKELIPTLWRLGAQSPVDASSDGTAAALPLGNVAGSLDRFYNAKAPTAAASAAGGEASAAVRAVELTRGYMTLRRLSDQVLALGVKHSKTSTAQQFRDCDDAVQHYSYLWYALYPVGSEAPLPPTDACRTLAREDGVPPSSQEWARRRFYSGESSDSHKPELTEDDDLPRLPRAASLLDALDAQLRRPVSKLVSASNVPARRHPGTTTSHACLALVDQGIRSAILRVEALFANVAKGDELFHCFAVAPCSLSHIRASAVNSVPPPSEGVTQRHQQQSLVAAMEQSLCLELLSIDAHPRHVASMTASDFCDEFFPLVAKSKTMQDLSEHRRAHGSSSVSDLHFVRAVLSELEFPAASFVVESPPGNTGAPSAAAMDINIYFTAQGVRYIESVRDSIAAIRANHEQEAAHRMRDEEEAAMDAERRVAVANAKRVATEKSREMLRRQLLGPKRDQATAAEERFSLQFTPHKRFVDSKVISALVKSTETPFRWHDDPAAVANRKRDEAAREEQRLLLEARRMDATLPPWRREEGATVASKVHLTQRVLQQVSQQNSVDSVPKRSAADPHTTSPSRRQVQQQKKHQSTKKQEGFGLVAWKEMINKAT